MHTVFASAKEGQLVAVYRDPILLADGSVQILGQLQTVQVTDAAALGADEMCVRGSTTIKVLLTVDHTYAFDHPLLLEENQVAVDGTQAQVRVFRFEGLVDPLGGGVTVSVFDGLQNGLALFAISDGFFHVATSLLIIIIVYAIILPHSGEVLKRVWGNIENDSCY
jgi:hypothetical protein